jgi:hypothetical protein
MGLQGSSACLACGEVSHWKTRAKLAGNCPGCGELFKKANVAIQTVTESNGVKPASETEQSLTAGQRGYRACACGKYSSITREACWSCSLVFGKSENVEKESPKRVPTAEELALKTWKPGYRQCNNCNHFTAGPRSTECVHCENLFPKKDRAVVKVAEKTEDQTERMVEVKRFPEEYTYPDNGMPIQRIGTPRGECPYKIPRSSPDAFPSDDAIKAWAYKVREALISRNEFLGNSAILYWAKQQVNGDGRYRYNSEEMQYLKMVIDSLPDVTTRRVPAA